MTICIFHFQHLFSRLYYFSSELIEHVQNNTGKNPPEILSGTTKGEGELVINRKWIFNLHTDHSDTAYHTQQFCGAAAYALFSLVIFTVILLIAA